MPDSTPSNVRMCIDVLTLFPEMFESVLGSSILKRAAESVKPLGPGSEHHPIRPPVVSYQMTNIRDYTKDKHGKVDQPPYGGGPGMVIQCQPVWDAVQAVNQKYASDSDNTKIVKLIPSPQGEVLTQAKAAEMAQADRMMILTGHYEGFDERVMDKLHEEDWQLISIGDYVLSGGELAAMVLIDSVVRLIPGVLGDHDSVQDESFGVGTGGLLDYPHYTRPREWMGEEVPAILLSGDHGKIEVWRREQSLFRTQKLRPDLLG